VADHSTIQRAAYLRPRNAVQDDNAFFWRACFGSAFGVPYSDCAILFPQTSEKAFRIRSLAVNVKRCKFSFVSATFCALWG
jgi:hypothetical protein